MAQGAESQQERNSWSGQRAILPCAPIRSFLCLSASWSSLLILACRDSVACEPWDCYFDSGQTWCASQNNGAVRWCVCVCVFERGKRKEGKGGTRGLFGCACRRALCVCMQQVCMHEEQLLKWGFSWTCMRRISNTGAGTDLQHLTHTSWHFM